jgi:hypothetical protein
LCLGGFSCSPSIRATQPSEPLSLLKRNISLWSVVVAQRPTQSVRILAQTQPIRLEPCTRPTLLSPTSNAHGNHDFTLVYRRLLSDPDSLREIQSNLVRKAPRMEAEVTQTRLGARTCNCTLLPEPGYACSTCPFAWSSRDSSASYRHGLWHGSTLLCEAFATPIRDYLAVCTHLKQPLRRGRVYIATLLGCSSVDHGKPVNLTGSGLP